MCLHGRPPSDGPDPAALLRVAQCGRREGSLGLALGREFFNFAILASTNAREMTQNPRSLRTSKINLIMIDIMKERFSAVWQPVIFTAKRAWGGAAAPNFLGHNPSFLGWIRISGKS